MNAFEKRLAEQGEGALLGLDLDVLTANVTLRCNQACAHCHVGSSPRRTEVMGPDVLSAVVAAARKIRPSVVDITGGAPELNANLPDFLRVLRADGHRVQLRTNLTALSEPSSAGLAALFADLGIELLASMPDYADRNVAVVRGAGVRDASVEALLELNALGYGVDGGLRLDLVYNPVGTNLPEPQGSLDELFHAELAERFGVSFTRLLTMTNMPVGRFRDRLVVDGGYDRYLRGLREAFNPDVVPLLQCRHQVEVGWDGRFYDCDFNLGNRTPASAEAPRTVFEFDVDAVAHRPIVHGDRCFGCTAGAGSS